MTKTLQCIAHLRLRCVGGTKEKVEALGKCCLHGLIEP